MKPTAERVSTASFFQGCFVGVLISIPLWVVLGYAIAKVVW